MNIPDEELSELGSQIALLDTVAMSGYQFGLSDGINAANNAFAGASVCESRGGRKKKGAGARKKRVMRGGDILSRSAKLNLLTIAVILGGGYASYIAGAGGSVLAGFDFCYRQGRSILYALNWLKRPCTTDAAIISGLLFKSIPGFGAGAKTCLEIANKLELQKYILTFNLKGKKNHIEDKVLADSCEALIGSIYLDKGFSSVEKIILDLWSTHIKDSIITQIDAKTKLQEFSLKRFKKLPIYKLISNTGPRHKPLFKVGVKLIDTKFYISEGKSKKDAEQNAAILCLQNIKKI